jgi:hypothetical protein
MIVRPFTPGTHEVRSPFLLKSDTSYDLTGVHLVTAGGATPQGVLWGHQLDNVEIIGGTLNGNIAGAPAWSRGLWPASESQHLILLEDCRGVTIRGVRFEAPRGDGVLLYSRGSAGPGCNGIKLLDCSFHGNADNRNGVSIVHASNVEIGNCLLAGMSRPDMPGAIDIEPNYAHETCWEIWIHQTRIEGGGANGLQIYNPGGAQIGNVLMEGCAISGRRKFGAWCVGSAAVSEGPVAIRGTSVTDAETRLYVDQMSVSTDFPKKRRRKKRRR